jgi:hypothetical protein
MTMESRAAKTVWKDKEGRPEWVPDHRDHSETCKEMICANESVQWTTDRDVVGPQALVDIHANEDSPRVTGVCNFFDASSMYEDIDWPTDIDGGPTKKTSIMQLFLDALLQDGEENPLWQDQEKMIGFTDGDDRDYVTIYKTDFIPLPVPTGPWEDPEGTSYTKSEELCRFYDSLTRHEQNPQKKLPDYLGYLSTLSVPWPALSPGSIRDMNQDAGQWLQEGRGHPVRMVAVPPKDAPPTSSGRHPIVSGPENIRYPDLFPDWLIDRFIQKCHQHFRKLFPNAGKGGFRYAVTQIGVLRGGSTPQLFHTDMTLYNEFWAKQAMHTAGCIPCSMVYECYSKKNKDGSMKHTFVYVDPGTTQKKKFTVHTMAPDGLVFSGSACHRGECHGELSFRIHVHWDVEGLPRVVDSVDTHAETELEKLYRGVSDDFKPGKVAQEELKKLEAKWRAMSETSPGKEFLKAVKDTKIGSNYVEYLPWDRVLDLAFDAKERYLIYHDFAERGWPTIRRGKEQPYAKPGYDPKGNPKKGQADSHLNMYFVGTEDRDAFKKRFAFFSDWSSHIKKDGRVAKKRKASGDPDLAV